MIQQEPKYNQNQIHIRAEYYGKYMYYACRLGLSGHSLRVAVAKDMKALN